MCIYVCMYVCMYTYIYIYIYIYIYSLGLQKNISAAAAHIICHGCTNLPEAIPTRTL